MPFFTSSSWKALLHGTWGVSSVVFLAAWYSTVWVNPCGHTRTWRCSQKILRTELEGTRPHVLLGNGYAWDNPEVGLLDPEPVRSLLVTLRRFLCSRVLKKIISLFVQFILPVCSGVFASCDLLASSSFPWPASCSCLHRGDQEWSSGSQLSVGLNPRSATCWLNGCRQEACSPWASIFPSTKWVYFST